MWPSFAFKAYFALGALVHSFSGALQVGLLKHLGDVATVLLDLDLVLTRSRKYDHITPILQSLHWPIKFHISYKILLLAYKALNGLAPAYLTSLLSRYNPSRSLRSHNSGLLVVPRVAKSTKGGRAFSYLAPKLWNSLPDNVRGSDTLSLFKSRLKTSL